MWRTVCIFFISSAESQRKSYLHQHCPWKQFCLVWICCIPPHINASTPPPHMRTQEFLPVGTCAYMHVVCCVCFFAHMLGCVGGMGGCTHSLCVYVRCVFFMCGCSCMFESVSRLSLYVLFVLPFRFYVLFYFVFFRWKSNRGCLPRRQCWRFSTTSPAWIQPRLSPPTSACTPLCSRVARTAAFLVTTPNAFSGAQGKFCIKALFHPKIAPLQIIHQERWIRTRKVFLVTKNNSVFMFFSERPFSFLKEHIFYQKPHKIFSHEVFFLENNKNNPPQSAQCFFLPPCPQPPGPWRFIKNPDL